MKIIENNIYVRDIKKAWSKLDASALDDKIVLVTGGLGLIGSAIVDMLLIYGKLKKIYVAARSIESYNEKYKGVDVVEFCKYDALRPIDFDFEVDYIIHGAGIASPELYVKNPVETMMSNIEGVRNLLEFARVKGIKRLLYISSSEVYGKKNTVDSFVETDYGAINLDDIRSSYPVAKRASEILCKSYIIEHGVNAVIVRPGHIFGPSASRKDKRLSSDFVYKAADGTPLDMKSSGIQSRSYCYSIDCAVQIIIALLYGEKGEAYNIGCDEITSIREFAKLCANIGKVDLNCVDPSQAEIEAFNPMDNSTLNNCKIKSLGYNDTFSVFEGIKNTIDIIRECGL